MFDLCGVDRGLMFEFLLSPVQVEVVISLLPPSCHIIVANACIEVNITVNMLH